MLAGVSSDYYVRLERGYLGGDSENVLDSIVRALRLNDAERQHLHDLARSSTSRAPRTRRAAKKKVPASVQAMLDAMTGAPAIVHNDRLDLLACSALGRALYSQIFESQTQRANHARFAFFEPRSRDF